MASTEASPDAPVVESVPAPIGRILPFIPAALLISIACLQIYRAHRYDQSPWKGGGFGMFATHDSVSSRVLHCSLVTPKGELRVSVPRVFRPMSLLARTVPTQENLDRLARELAGATWVKEDYHTRHLADAAAAHIAGVDDPPPPPEPPAKEEKDKDKATLRFRIKAPREPDPPPSERAEVTAVRVVIWRTSFDAKTTRLAIRKAGEALIPVPSK